MTLLIHLPRDVLLVILGLLEPFELCRLCQTNTTLQHLSSHNSLWKRVYLSTLSNGARTDPPNCVAASEKCWKLLYLKEGVPIWKPAVSVKSKQKLRDNFRSAQTVSTVLLSDGAVGKSSIVHRFLHHVFRNKNDPTIEDVFQKDINIITNSTITIEIADTSGIDVYRHMKEYYIKRCEGFIFLYSITNKKSFEAIPKLISKAQQLQRTTDIPMVLVGTKSDLYHERQVSVTSGKQLAQQFNCPFFEVSALRDDMIQEMFVEICVAILLRRNHTKKSSHQQQGIDLYPFSAKRKLKSKCAVM